MGIHRVVRLKVRRLVLLAPEPAPVRRKARSGSWKKWRDGLWSSGFGENMLRICLVAIPANDNRHIMISTFRMPLMKKRPDHTIHCINHVELRLFLILGDRCYRVCRRFPKQTCSTGFSRPVVFLL